MNRRILLLRPEPGVSESAARARTLGLQPVVAPLLSVRPIGWDAPDPVDFDAVLLTSANAPRWGGPGLARFTALPCFAVGAATARAAREAGFRRGNAGPSDVAALLDEIAARAAGDPQLRLFHPCGRDHVSAVRHGVSIVHVPVYAAAPVAALPAIAREALSDGAIALLHSPRTAALFAKLVDDAAISRDTVRIAAISPAAMTAAGGKWAANIAAAVPRDEAMLELAARMAGVKD